VPSSGSIAVTKRSIKHTINYNLIDLITHTLRYKLCLYVAGGDDEFELLSCGTFYRECIKKQSNEIITRGSNW